MSDRTLEATLNLVDNFTTPIMNAIELMDSFVGKYTVELGLDDSISSVLDDIQEKIGEVTESLGGTDEAFKSVEDVAKNSGDAINESMSTANKSVSDLNSNLQDTSDNLQQMVGLASGVAIGGAVSGLSFMSAEKARLFKEDISSAGDSIRAWGLKTGEMKDAIERLGANTWTTEASVTDTMAKVFGAGQGKAFGTQKLKGEPALEVASGIQKILAAHTEIEGVNQQSLIRAISTKGELPQTGIRNLLTPFTLATMEAHEKMSNYDQLVKTTAGRVKILREENKLLNEQKMDELVSKQPWVEAGVAVEKLKIAIGETLIPTMTLVANIFTNILNIVRAIPIAPWLIGIAAMALAAGSAFRILMFGMSPIIGLFNLLKTSVMAAMGAEEVYTGAVYTKTMALELNTVAAAETAVADDALMLTDYGVAASAGAAAVSEDALAVSELGAGTAAGIASVGIWAMLTPILLIAVPLIGLIGTLYLVEQRTHAFSKALKTLTDPKFGTNTMKWLQGINDAIKDVTLGSGKFVLDVAYKANDALGQIIFKPLISLVDYIYKILQDTNALKKLFEFAADLWKRLTDLLGMQFDPVKAATKIEKSIHDALPKSVQNVVDWDPVKAGEEVRKKILDWIGTWTWPSFSWPTLPSVDTIFDDFKKGIDGIVTALTDFVDRIKNLLGIGGGTEEVSPSGKSSLSKPIEMGENFDATSLGLQPGDFVKDALGRVYKLNSRNVPALIGGTITGGEASYADTNEKAAASSQPGSGTRQGPSPPGTGWTVGGIGVPSVSTSNALEGDSSLYELNYASGTDYVPKTGPAWIHQGEKIIPASQNRGSGDTNISLNLGGIRIDKVTSDVDIAKLSDQISKIAVKSVKNALAQRRG